MSRLGEVTPYDPGNRPTRVDYLKDTFDVRDVVTRTYDFADRLQTETDAEGGITTYQYGKRPANPPSPTQLHRV